MSITLPWKDSNVRLCYLPTPALVEQETVTIRNILSRIRNFQASSFQDIETMLGTCIAENLTEVFASPQDRLTSLTPEEAQSLRVNIRMILSYTDNDNILHPDWVETVDNVINSIKLTSILTDQNMLSILQRSAKYSRTDWIRSTSTVGDIRQRTVIDILRLTGASNYSATQQVVDELAIFGIQLNTPPPKKVNNKIPLKIYLSQRPNIAEILSSHDIDTLGDLQQKSLRELTLPKIGPASRKFILQRLAKDSQVLRDAIYDPLSGVATPRMTLSKPTRKK